MGARKDRMKVLFWFFILLLAVLLALFAVANRELVSLAIWPLPFVVPVPLYLAVLVAVLIGFLAGALAGWLGGRRVRGERRRRGRRIAALERELAATQTRLAPPRSAG